MPRIRTVKPEFFKHEDLYIAEFEEKLPLRLAFIGLWCIADREGRFKWRPNQIKIDVLPYDDCDFSRVLDALATRGFVVQYECENGVLYGYIPSFVNHQVINNRESQSLIPSPFDACTTRDPRGLSMHKGKGRERKGKEGKELTQNTREEKTEIQDICKKTWQSYAHAYMIRYKVEPVRNAKVNSQIKNFVKRIGENESPQVARHYLKCNDKYYVSKAHSVDCMLVDAEKLRTEWASGVNVNYEKSRFTNKSSVITDAEFENWLNGESNGRIEQARILGDS